LQLSGFDPYNGTAGNYTAYNTVLPQTTTVTNNMLNITIYGDNVIFSGIEVVPAT
jgi:hypothetical protein